MPTCEGRCKARQKMKKSLVRAHLLIARRSGPRRCSSAVVDVSGAALTPNMRGPQVLTRLPKVLVLHLKRFVFNRYSRAKITTKVKFPVKVYT